MIIFLLIFVIIVLIFIVVNLFQKLNKIKIEYEKIIDIHINTHNDVLAIIKLIIATKSEMERIDHRGIFVKDDDVGFAFEAINKSIHTLANTLDELIIKE